MNHKLIKNKVGFINDNTPSTPLYAANDLLSGTWIHYNSIGIS